MKKVFACLLALMMSVLMLAACGANNSNTGNNAGNDAVVDTDNRLADAKDYLRTMYMEAASLTPMDFIRVGAVRIDGVSYPIEWSADTDLISFEYDDSTKMVTVKVNNSNKEDVNYTLTATLTDENGATESVAFSHCVPASKSYEDIVKEAYTLEAGKNMDGTFRLEGVITKIDTPWSDEYKNITVTIQVGDLADMPIMCYRLKGEGAESLAVTDTITVTGMIKNYNGTIEFDAGCLVEKIVKGEGIPESELPPAPDQDLDVKDVSAVLNTAYALEDGQAFSSAVTLTGVITKIDTEWSDQYGNISVTIVVDGKDAQPIMCYRLKGDGAKDLAVGDTITATGILKNYKGTIEFDAGCTLDAVVKGAGSSDKPAEPEKPATNDPKADSTLSIADAIALGASKEHNTYTEGKYYVTGVITEVYNTQYGNMKITDASGNILTIYGTYSADGSTRYDAMETKPVAGDTVTIYGIIGQYSDAPQIKNGWITSHTASEKPAESEPATEPEQPAATVSGFVDAPVADTAYKFAMHQASLGVMLYFTGEMDGYYLAMSENIADGVDVFVESVDGGIRVYFMSNGTKTYIDIVPRDGAAGKTNVVLSTTPSAVYTWDAERKALIANVEGENWYLGTYNNYKTISPAKFSYIEDVSKIGVSQFVAGFFTPAN